MAELNGAPVELGQLQTLALTNYGHFTSMRVENGRVRGLTLHMERLQRDCRALFGADLDLQRVRELARRAAPASGSTTVRVTIFDPSLDLGHPREANDPHILVTSRSASPLPLPPLSVQSLTYVRDVPTVKSVGLFASLHYRRLAQLNGFDDAVFIDADQVVSEGGTWNIGFFDGDHVLWPDADCLVGVTMELLKSAHEFQARRIRLADLADMRAAFATNAAIGVRAIRGIDGIELPESHAIVDSLRKVYLAIEGDML